MNKYGFQRHKKIGKISEEIIIDFFTSCGYKIEDVRSKKIWQQQNIDLIVRKNRHKKLIEIKSDTYYSTGNYFFETFSSIEDNKPGCFISSKADYFYYLFIPEMELHIIPLKSAKRWFRRNRKKFKMKRVQTTINNKVHHTSEGALVPRASVPYVKIIKLR